MSEARAKIPFVIFFLERSGSSHLCTLLDSHPQISCGNEEFTTKRSDTTSPHQAPRYIHSREHKLLDPSDAQSLDHLKNIFARGQRASGFKLKYPLQFNRYPEILDALQDRNDQLRVIHLDRKNVLKKFVSKQVLVQQRANNPEFRRKEDASFQPIEIETAALLETLNRFEKQRDELSQLLVPFQHVLEIEYEEFNQESEALPQRLKEFLDVDRQIELTSKMVKRAPKEIHDAVTNFDELASVVKGTRFETMLD